LDWNGARRGHPPAVFEAAGIRPSPGGFTWWRPLAGLAITSCFGALTLLNAGGLVSDEIRNFASWLVIGVALLGGILVSNARKHRLYWIREKLKGTDYDGALARADALLKWSPGSPMLHFLRGTVLLFKGRLPEAEESLRTSIAKHLVRGGVGLIGALTNLGSVLLRQKRFREAAAALEVVHKIHPQFSAAHNDLAEVLLTQGQEPQRALLLVENALKLKLGNARLRNADRHSTAYMYANRALALAMLGRMEEASASVEMAKDSGDPSFIPGLAGTAWRCGLALVRMQKFQAAREQFQQAATIDPQGLYGKLAASALQE
jgi:tetratricopeptide (TPR) repeat protein